MITRGKWIALSCALVAPGSARAAFEGPYAQELWTFTTEAGGFVDKHTADTLVLVGGDGSGAGDTDLTIVAAASGTWTFSWQFYGSCFGDGGIASGGFDLAYYLVNGVAHFLSNDGYPSLSTESVAIQTGDVIGFRVITVDGIFGPGELTVTNFSAPVPGPASLALLATLVGLRRRSRYDGSNGQ